jgi:uncharacterized membrane protein YgdD (TMEM256/DUF423 family)
LPMPNAMPPWWICKAILNKISIGTSSYYGSINSFRFILSRSFSPRRCPISGLVFVIGWSVWFS